VSWLAQRVRAGELRWVLVESSATGGAGGGVRLFSSGVGGSFGGASFAGRGGPGGGGGGLPGDNRTGSQKAFDAVERACVKVDTSTGAGTLYDCNGRAAQLEALARE
jgi:hypothetical protein